MVVSLVHQMSTTNPSNCKKKAMLGPFINDMCEFDINKSFVFPFREVERVLPPVHKE